MTRDGLLIHASMTGKQVWSLPVQGVIITEVSRKVMAIIEVRSQLGAYRVEWVSPDNIPKLQQALLDAQSIVYQSYTASAYPPNAPTAPQSGYFRPPPVLSSSRPPKRSAWRWYRAKSKNAQAGIGCLVIVGMLLVCGSCIGTMNAALGNSSSDVTPTVQSNSSNAAAQLAQDSPTTQSSQPTATPTTAKPKPTPKPAPTHKPAPTPTPKPKCQAVNSNPWCYNFASAGGHFIYNPPSNFCDYFNCIASFWNGSGFVNECYDQTYSLSGGHQGDCSHHGGEWRPLYSH